MNRDNWEEYYDNKFPITEQENHGHTEYPSYMIKAFIRELIENL